MSELQTIDAIYVGRRLIQGNKLGEAYIPVSLLEDYVTDTQAWDHLNHNASLFAIAKKNAWPGIVGGVFEIKCELDLETGRIQKIISATRKFKELYHSEDWRLAMASRDEANYNMYKQELSKKKLAGRSDLKNELTRLRMAYKSCAPQERLGFEMAVLSYLRSGS